MLLLSFYFRVCGLFLFSCKKWPYEVEVLEDVGSSEAKRGWGSPVVVVETGRWENRSCVSVVFRLDGVFRGMLGKGWAERWMGSWSEGERKPAMNIERLSPLVCPAPLRIYVPRVTAVPSLPSFHHRP